MSHVSPASDNQGLHNPPFVFLCLDVMGANIWHNQNSWIRDPTYKHEYLDRVQSWLMVTEENDDESDKHLVAQDRRYSCLKLIIIMAMLTICNHENVHIVDKYLE